MTCGIYKIEHPSGLVYVGQSQDCNKRWLQHVSEAFGRRYCFKLYKAMRSLGLENFTFSILEECAVEDLDEREVHWMRKLNALDPVMGLNTGVDPVAPNRGKKASAETRAKMSESQRGRKHSEESRVKIGAVHIGKEVSEETRAKISKAKRRDNLSAETRRRLSEAAKARETRKREARTRTGSLARKRAS